VRLSSGHYSSFIVRIRSRTGGGYQGQITDVGTRRRAHFRDPQRLLAFIFAAVSRQAPPDERAAGEADSPDPESEGQ
jgi:hypothetical protein